MITISFSIALIAIVFGAKLLAQSQKDSLGALYKYLSWFIIVMGFLVLMCDGAQGFLKMCHRGEGRMMNKQYMMMDRDDGMMGNCPMWMMHHRNMCHGDGCDGMMNCHEGGNCSMHDGGNCDMTMGCKDEGKDGSCKEGGMGGSCPMMGGMKDKKDSAKGKK